MTASLPPQLYSAFLNSDGVCTDTRKVAPNTLFFALKGANFNGNAFANQALEAGCSFAIIDEPQYQIDDRTILVQDVLTCLQDLARHHRNQLAIPVIGITGSNGKTSTKELIASVLGQQFQTFATHGNLNNHIGVPLSILSIGPKIEMAVIEMGANHVGEIADLCTISMPDYGMITNIGKAHLEGFGGVEGVIKGKSELYKHLQEHAGTVFVNADDELLMKLSSDLQRITYGSTLSADCRGSIGTTTDYVSLNWSDMAISSQMVGNYNFANMMAAICIGTHFGVAADKIKTAIEGYQPDNNRSQLVKTQRNTIVLDAYNANPISMEAAIRNFSEMGHASPILILGDMLELGDYSAAEHQKIVDLTESLGFEVVMLVGPEFCKTSTPASWMCFEQTSQAANNLKANQIASSQLLIKGSRGIRLELLVELL